MGKEDGGMRRVEESGSAALHSLLCGVTSFPLPGIIIWNVNLLTSADDFNKLMRYSPRSLWRSLGFVPPYLPPVCVPF